MCVRAVPAPLRRFCRDRSEIRGPSGGRSRRPRRSRRV